MRRSFGGSGRRRWLVVVVSLVTVVTVGSLVWVLWPADGPVEPRARQYLDFTACLLTDEKGVAGPEAAPVWAGLQDASLATRAKVQYLAVVGPQTVANAGTFLASLAQGRCDVILAAGEVPVATVVRDASQFAGVRFVVVGGGVSSSNVSVLIEDSGDAVRAAVGRLVTGAVGASSPGR
jgi:hypothetical protein